MLRLNQEMLSGALRAKRQSTPLRVVALAIGVPSSTLTRIERSIYKPRTETFLAVCHWLDRDPRDFAIYKDQEP